MGHNLVRGDLALPFASGENWTISQGFDNKLTWFNKELKKEVPVYDAGGHEGIDWSCCSGTPIHAMATGRVSLVDAGETKGGLDKDDYTSGKPYGNQVRIRTGTGTNGFELTYAHLANVYVCLGQEVVQGQLLGLSGHTGRGNRRHLHVHLTPFGRLRQQPTIRTVCQKRPSLRMRNNQFL
jgi:murein DD-endopeptidase MepM/ murein hydrolase activator NlpD